MSVYPRSSAKRNIIFGRSICASAKALSFKQITKRRLDKEIIGQVGFQRYEVNAFGKRIRQIDLDKGQAGQNYKTTLDLDIQEFTTKTIENLAASVCVMDIYNGDVITMVSSPNYDPNAFVHGIDKKIGTNVISGFYSG